jgi:hypothetical protein
VPFAVDGYAHETQQRNPGCLHVGAQYLIRVAPGEKYIGADDLCGVIGADTQYFRRFHPQRECQPEQQQDESDPDAA